MGDTKWTMREGGNALICVWACGGENGGGMGSSANWTLEYASNMSKPWEVQGPPFAGPYNTVCVKGAEDPRTKPNPMNTCDTTSTHKPCGAAHALVCAALALPPPPPLP